MTPTGSSTRRDDPSRDAGIVRAEDGGDRTAPSPIEDKCVWTLVRPEGTGFAAFRHYVLEDLGKAVGRLLPSATGVMVTFQEPNAFSGATVRLREADRRIDAVLQVTVVGARTSRPTRSTRS